MDIIVTTIKQIGREIMLDGNSLIGYQHSANLFIKLIEDTSESNPFAGMVLSAYCSSWKSDMPIVCPLIDKEDGAYILLPEGVFDNEGDVYLSLAAIDENKIVITSNQLTLQVDESNRIVSKVSPSEKYWEIEVLNAMKVWYAEVVNPTFTASEEKLNQLIRRTEEHEEKAEDLQKKAEDQQTTVDQSVASAAQATQTANAAAANANEKAAAANTAAQAANKAKGDADTATSNANKAASDAITAKNNADGAATRANEAAAIAEKSKTILYDDGVPIEDVGRAGDTYVNTGNSESYPYYFFTKEAEGWQPRFSMIGKDGTDTVSVGAGYVISGDEIPAGYKEATPPFSNPNLLINGDFQIWQRGERFSGKSVKTYTADRWWYYNADGVIAKVSTGLQTNCAIHQNLEIKLCGGKKYIISYSVDGTIYIRAITGQTYDSGYVNNVKYFLNSNGYEEIAIRTDTTCIINWAKLELGEIATPLIPRPYAEELMLCQRYFYKIGSDTVYMNGGTFCIYEKAIKLLLNFNMLNMRVVPTISVVNPSLTLFGIVNANNINITNFGVAYGINLINVIDYDSRVTYPEGTSGLWQVSPNCNIAIDAEIY